MPNWCYQKLEISGEPKQLNKLLKKIEVTKNEATDVDDETPFSFDNVIPMPKHLHNNQGWYDWRVTNWGTKWQPRINNDSVSEWESGSIHFDFDTAWSPPYPIIEALVKEFKKLEFHWEYYEESYEFWGIHNFKGGKEVSYEGGKFDSCNQYNHFGLDHHWCASCGESLECDKELTETSLCETCDKEMIETDTELWDTTTEGVVPNGNQALLS